MTREQAVRSDRNIYVALRLEFLLYWRHRNEGSIPLNDGHNMIGEHPHVEFCFMGRHAALAELENQVIHTGQLAQFIDLLNAIVRRTYDLNFYIVLIGFLSSHLILQVLLGLGPRSVRLVALDRSKMAFGNL